MDQGSDNPETVPGPGGGDTSTEGSSKRQRQRQRQRKNRSAKYAEIANAERQQAAEKAGIATIPDEVAVIYRHARPDIREKMKGKNFRWDNKIFTDPATKFLRIGGKGSGVIYVLDEDSHELVFAARITERKDMTPRKEACFAQVFDFFQRSKLFYPRVQINHAMIKGGMTAIGWRSAMETGVAFGTYVPNQYGKDHPEAWKAHGQETGKVHRIFAESFLDISPAFYHHQVEERANLGVPGLGLEYSDELTDFNAFAYCSNLAFTYDGFENLAHTDNDASTYTHGISGNVDARTGKMASFSDGYEQQGGFFYVADYAILIDYCLIDGVVEQIWLGPKHVHGTAGGVIKEGYTRFGSSTQINERLTGRVKGYKGNGIGKIMSDNERYKQLVRSSK